MHFQVSCDFSCPKPDMSFLLGHGTLHTCSALHVVAQSTQAQIIVFCMRYQIDPNEQGTPLEAASLTSNVWLFA